MFQIDIIFETSSAKGFAYCSRHIYLVSRVTFVATGECWYTALISDKVFQQGGMSVPPVRAPSSVSKTEIQLRKKEREK